MLSICPFHSTCPSSLFHLKNLVCTYYIPGTLLGAMKGYKKVYDLIMEKFSNCIEQYVNKCQLY